MREPPLADEHQSFAKDNVGSLFGHQNATRSGPGEKNLLGNPLGHDARRDLSPTVTLIDAR